VNYRFKMLLQYSICCTPNSPTAKQPHCNHTHHLSTWEL